MKCLITGGAGFIGSHLTELLVENGHEALVIDDLSSGRMSNLLAVQNCIEFIEADINSPDTRSAYRGVDVVFHLAAKADVVPSIINPVGYMKDNVWGTLSVLENCRASGVGRVIYAASSSCYGLALSTPTTESAPTDPRYPYALSKLLGEQILTHWGRLYGIQTLSLRLFNVFGLRSRTSGNYGAVLGVFLAQHLSGKPLTIVGDGEQSRDFVFVSDVAKALVAAAKYSGDASVINIGSGRPITVNQVANTIGGRQVNVPDRPGEPRTTHADISLAKKELQWSPKVSFEDGLNIVMAQKDLWKDAPIWTPETISEATRDWFKHVR